MTGSSFKTPGGGEEGGGVQDELLSSTGREREWGGAWHWIISTLVLYIVRNRQRRISGPDTGLLPVGACGCSEHVKPPHVACHH